MEDYKSGNSLGRSPFDPAVETRWARNTEPHRETPKAKGAIRAQEPTTKHGPTSSRMVLADDLASRTSSSSCMWRIIRAQEPDHETSKYAEAARTFKKVRDIVAKSDVYVKMRKQWRAKENGINC